MLTRSTKMAIKEWKAHKGKDHIHEDESQIGHLGDDYGCATQNGRKPSTSNTICFRNNGVVLMPLPGEKWFCVAAFNNLELQRDLERADRQKQWWRGGMAREMERWHGGKQEETRELKHVTNITWNPDTLAQTPSFSLCLTQTWTCASTEKVCLTSFKFRAISTLLLVL